MLVWCMVLSAICITQIYQSIREKLGLKFHFSTSIQKYVDKRMQIMLFAVVAWYIIQQIIPCTTAQS